MTLSLDAFNATLKENKLYRAIDEEMENFLLNFVSYYESEKQSHTFLASASSADLFQELGMSKLEAAKEERNLNAYLIREQMKIDNS